MSKRKMAEISHLQAYGYPIYTPFTPFEGGLSDDDMKAFCRSRVLLLSSID
jgi:hypothetical protein